MQTKAIALLVMIALITQVLPAVTFAQQAQGQAQETVSKDEIKVYFNDMHCEGCAKKIRSRIFTIKGVKSVSTSVSEDVAVIKSQPGNELPLKKLWETLEEADFEINRIVTASKTITEKPEV